MAEITSERKVAFEVLRRTFEDGEFTERAFRQEVTSAGLEGRDRAFAQFLAFGAVQRKGTSDALVREFSRRGQRSGPAAINALRLGLFEIFFSGGGAEHAAVDQAVEITRRSGESRASGFVNAILRRAIRESDEIRRRLADDSTIPACSFAHSVPGWLVEMWWEELGPERTRSLCAAINLPTEKCLMVNPRRGEVEEILGRLGGGEVDVSPAEGPWPLAPEGLLVASGSLAAAEQVAELGEITILSRGSAAVVEVLGPEEGERVLDLCSGPGIKTGRIAASVGHYGNVVAVEPESARADDVAAQLDRLGYHNTLVVEGDGRGAEILSDFDRVLVDAPCSDLGALASRPDARWRKNPSVIARLLDLQSELLDRAGDLVRPGGTVVYSTCTISRRENADQAIAFAERSGLEPDDLGALAPDLADPTDSRFIQLFPDRDSTTGFFIARFRKPLVPEVGE